MNIANGEVMLKRQGLLILLVSELVLIQLSAVNRDFERTIAEVEVSDRHVVLLSIHKADDCRV